MISTEEGVSDIRKSAALIHGTFQVDPYRLEEQEFVKLAVDALFFQDFKRRQMEAALLTTIVKLFPDNG